MAWFRVDDQLTFHPKIVRAGNAAIGAWVRLGTYCSAQLTDGFIPDSVARMIATARELEALVKASMVYQETEGFRLHDYLEYQPSKEQTKAHREATKQRVKRFRNASGNGVTNGVSNANVPVGMGIGVTSGSVSGGEVAGEGFSGSRLQDVWREETRTQPTFKYDVLESIRAAIVDSAELRKHETEDWARLLIRSFMRYRDARKTFIPQVRLSSFLDCFGTCEQIADGAAPEDFAGDSGKSTKFRDATDEFPEGGRIKLGR